MPSRKWHLEFDEVLRDKGVIMEDTDGTAVHNRLDRNASRYGPTHREDDEWHNPESVRAMIDNLATFSLKPFGGKV